ncbi:hypothetical protein MRX96_018806 [Rhipicephalus microplus]
MPPRQPAVVAAKARGFNGFCARWAQILRMRRRLADAASPIYTQPTATPHQSGSGSRPTALLNRFLYHCRTAAKRYAPSASSPSATRDATTSARCGRSKGTWLQRLLRKMGPDSAHVERTR